MLNDQTCIVCEGITGAQCSTFQTGRDTLGFECEACGRFEITRSLVAGWSSYSLTALQRSALSHRVCIADRSREAPILDSYWLKEFSEELHPLPSPAIQAANLIRLIGDHQSAKGDGFFPMEWRDAASVGSFGPRMFNQLLAELLESKLLIHLDKAERPNPHGGGVLSGRLLGLSLSGWEKYEAEKRGKISGKYGFLAMAFNDVELEKLAASTIKPSVEERLGYSVIDVRDRAKAGVIDNIMREQIRDAAFVLADLTHDNRGAYWEAGYAEGLGKPVIYICQREKFESVTSHFDTNHCTTVMWTAGEEASFIDELTATLRRSLDLF